MKDSKIEWTHHTFNPWRGCTKVSDGCRNCYAEKLSHRNPAVLGVWGDNGTRVVASESAWREPLKWDRAAAKAGERHRVFCASLADVFEDRDELIEPRRRLFHLIDSTPNLDWLLLTKRPENIAKLWNKDNCPPGWRPNVWLGVSVENQEAADKRIPELLKCRSLAPVLFLSCEPLLGPVDLNTLLLGHCPKCGYDEGVWQNQCKVCGHDSNYAPPLRQLKGGEHVAAINWVIVGGESGPAARPMHPDWARSLRDQCNSAGVPFFFKQHGEWIGMPDYSVHTHGMDINKWPCRLLFPNGVDVDMVPNDDRRKYAQSHGLPTMVMRVGKTAAGRVLDGRTWDEIPGSE